TFVTGDWALRLLLATLAMTPLRRLLHAAWPLRLRRMLGLYAFFYASLHFLIWLVLDQELRWDAILADIAKRPYVTVGFTAWLLMLPLALTSTRAAMRRLGRRWARLHRLVYPTAVLGVLHYLWLVKVDITEPLIYGAILAVLLLARLRWSFSWPMLRRRLPVGD
ncbi:MAG TPA: sulfoxide reductase heme-binding subunit YedZ, partial [Gammaproteobacteria bacterium]|nr:sulfoxide reductase heme-binding subunit YedZ [Gammaproteobacteria bacterium]